MKPSFRNFTAALAITLVLGSQPALAKGGKKTFQPGMDTIAAIAVEAGNFQTLVAALTCTNLVGAVAAEGVELTVFAPTDEAFGNLNLNAGNICSADLPLADILLYHVVAERRPSPSVIRGMNKSIEMLSGGSIYPEGMGSLMMYDNLDRPIAIGTPDILASNGIIHVIDDVMLPVAP